MKFNVNKCGVMHIEKRSLEFQYQMNDRRVKSREEERDLGVLISKDLKCSRECLMAINKANSMLGIINRGLPYKSSEVILKLYRSYVRLHLIVLHTILDTNKYKRCRYAGKGSEEAN